MEGGQSSGNVELREARSRSPARRNDRGKTPVMEAPLIGSGKERSSYDQARHVERQAAGAVGMKRGVSVLDFVLRLVALAAALAATITMGTTDQTLPFFTQFFQFQAEYDDLPSFTYFVVANAVSSAYLVLSLPFSVVTIVRPLVKGPRLLLITLDAVVLALTVSAAGAATAIVYVAHKGNVNANWIAICQQFDSFCQRTSGAVVASFIAAVLFAILVILSAVALKG